MDIAFHHGFTRMISFILACQFIYWACLTRTAHSGGEDSHIREQLFSRQLQGRALIDVNVNQAQRDELMLLPNVGPVLAQRMIHCREALGFFSSVEDLGKVRGIGPKTIDAMRPIAVAEPWEPTRKSN